MSHYSQALRWRDNVKGAPYKRPLRGHSVFYEGDSIYSYGRHFEMGRVLRDKKGKVRLFLLNGDTYSVTTSRHQSELRSALRGETLVVIPYEALDSAGVDRDSIKLLEDTPPTSRTEKHRSTEMPEGAKWHEEPIMGYVDLTPERCAERLALWNRDAQERHERRVKWHAERPESYRDPGEFVPLTELEPHDRRVYEQTGTNRVLRPARNKWQEIKVTKQEDGSTLYEWETHHHRLGESLFRAKVRFPGGSRWATFLSGWDMQESRPLYFLSEMPYRFKGTTVEEAYQALKPETVVLAEAMGREVKRQGDIFAIPAPSVTKRELRAKGARFEKRGQLLKTNHVATEVAYLPGGLTMARGTLYHAPEGRRPDHARRTIGSEWHIIQKNTVPVTKRATTRRNAA